MPRISMHEFVSRWVASREKFDAALRSGNSDPFLELLVFPYQELTKELYPIMIENGFNDDDYGRVPFTEIAVMGLDSQSTYWIELAVRWLESGLPVTPPIISAIHRLVKSDQATENIRLRVQRIATKNTKVKN